MTSLSVLLKDLVDVPAVFDVTLHGLTTDSRVVRPGDAFCALSGSQTPADHYVDAAIAAGAVAVLMETSEQPVCYERADALVVTIPDMRARLGTIADRFYGSPSRHLDVVGVTGTNGKTSVTSYLSQLLSLSGRPCGVIGTLGHGLAGQLRTASHTTPDVVRINQALSDIREAGGRAVAMEVSSHALAQGRTDGLRIRGAVFTNLSHDHLDYHGSMEAYGAAKSLLFRQQGVEFAVINFDDPFGRQLDAQLSGETDRLRYSLHESQTEIWLTQFLPHVDGFDAEVDGKWGRFSLNAPLLGSFNASNLLAATAAALSLGMSVDNIVAATPRLVAPPGRLESFSGNSGVRAVVDYAHTPDALRHVLEALKPHTDGLLWCVFGCGGDRDTSKRPVMAREVERLADCIIVTDDNPRNEDPALIVHQIMAGFENAERIIVTHDREAAIRQAIMQAGAGDVVLVAGKGHETYQEVRGERRDFSDAAMVRQGLADREAVA